MNNKLICQVEYENGVNIKANVSDYIIIKPKELTDSDITSLCVYSDEPTYMDIMSKTYKDILNFTYGVNRFSGIVPKKIIFNGPATIVMWTDGTKTVVKQSEHDLYDYEKGFAMCVVKKVFGDQYNHIRKMVDKSYKDTYIDASTDRMGLTEFKTFFRRGDDEH